MNEIVLDTSVIIKWFEKEKESDKAGFLLDAITSGKARMILPGFAQLEIVNILRLGKDFPAEKASKLIVDFFDLDPEFVEIDKRYALQISSLSYKSDITSYDAAFIAVSNQWNIPLFTADYKHHKKAISPHIVWLSEWDGRI